MYLNLTCFSVSRNSFKADEADNELRKDTYFATKFSCFANFESVGLIAQNGNVAERSPGNFSFNWKRLAN